MISDFFLNLTTEQTRGDVTSARGANAQPRGGEGRARVGRLSTISLSSFTISPSSW